MFFFKFFNFDIHVPSKTVQVGGDTYGKYESHATIDPHFATINPKFATITPGKPFKIRGSQASTSITSIKNVIYKYYNNCPV